MDAVEMFAVLETPDYESGGCSTVHLVCEDQADAEFYARSMRDDDIRVEPVQFVPKGRRDLVVEMQVWRAEVDVRPEQGQALPETVGWTCDPVRMWSRTEWRADDPEVSTNITRSGESEEALRQGRVLMWHVVAEGPTRGMTAKALDERLAGLLRQLSDGTLSGQPMAVPE